MSKGLNCRFQGRKGFTLIEILIVVAIIGLLTSIILVGLGAFRTRGRDARRIADLRETQNGLELYYTKSQIYPDVSSWGDLTTALINAGIGVSQVANDPLVGRNYTYSASADGQSYVLATTLEDADNTNLNDDIDGTVLNVSCDDPVYCIQF